MMALHVVNPNRGARLEMLEKHHARVRSVNLRLERENQRLASELGELESGLEGWRRVARREYGMVMPGEVVFRFPADERKRRAR